ncbi:MAG TPA: hypothetical protein VNC60_10635 [Actinomycetota bacterium]|nr:hypothetical protein [Actinomycetota bacterium]
MPSSRISSACAWIRRRIVPRRGGDVPTGRRVPTPSLRHYQLFRLLDEREAYEVRRDGHPVVGSFNGSFEEVVASYERAERRELEVTVP